MPDLFHPPRLSPTRLVTFLAGLFLASTAFTQTTVRASISSSGAQRNGGRQQAFISGDGRYVVFSSYANTLAPLPLVDPPSPNTLQIYRRDTLTNTTALVSCNDLGYGGDRSSFGPRVSQDGRYVSFSSVATNLVASDTNGLRDVFVKDMVSGTVIKVSLSDDESEGDGISDSSAISADGNVVAFRSDATNLVAGGTSGSQVFLRDISAGTTTLVSKSALGVPGDANSGSHQITISGTGRYVCFTSLASNLVVGDTNSIEDVYLRDMAAGTITRISIATNGLQGFGTSNTGSVSDNGRYVAFTSINGFVNNDTNGSFDVFVRDLVGNTMTRASVDSTGKQANSSSGWSGESGMGVRISGDGSKIVFQSQATNLVKGDTNGFVDIFVRDLTRNKTTLVSFDLTNKPTNAHSWGPSASTNGAYISFDSSATDLVTGDTNAFDDVFRRGAY